ncbi:MAG: hypothetical protein R2849_11605 [Thermomicrobiales bacterium]
MIVVVFFLVFLSLILVVFRLEQVDAVGHDDDIRGVVGALDIVHEIVIETYPVEEH